LKKFISKPSLFYAASLVIILFFFISIVAANILLVANKEKIEQELSRYLKHDTSLRSIYYIPPNFIILNDVCLEYNEPGKEYSPLSSSKITLSFSLPDMINKKNIVVDRVNFIRPRIDFHKNALFLKKKMERVIKVITMLSKGGPLKVSLEDADCIYQRNGDEVKSFEINAKLNADAAKKVESRGDIGFCEFKQKGGKQIPKQSFFSPRIIYSFSGALTPEKLNIENARVHSKNFQVRFQGSASDNILTLKGDSRVEKFYKSTGISNADKKKELLKQIGNLLRYGRFSRKVEMPSDKSIDISDIDLSIRFSPRSITVDKLKFYCEDIPVSAKGAVSLAGDITAWLKLSAFNNSNIDSRNAPRSFDADLKCKISKRKVSGQLDVAFFRKQARQSIKAVFNNLSFGLLPDKRLRIFSENTVLEYIDNGDAFELSLKGFNSMLNFAKQSVKFATFKSGIYEGGLEGYAACDISSDPFKISSKIKVDELNAEKIDSLLLHVFGAYRNLSRKITGHIGGEFSCVLDYVNYPLPRLHGKTTIKNGYLDNISFFVWLAGFFKIPELNKLDFNNLSLEFDSTKQSTSFKNIELKADKISLKGNFNIKENDLVESNISLVLPWEVLKTSPKFNLLLALISGKTDSLSFDFQLSGLSKALNFKWMESEFKRKIKKMLPGFVERGLEKKIEKATDSISD